jgi:hypothetical protein
VVVTRRTRAGLLIAAISITVIAPALANADGDPASDILLFQNVFYPYGGVSRELQQTLTAETAEAARAHAPIKVALISSPIDLGAIPELFGKPQQYAEFLDQELGIVGHKPPLLVVMPSGYGTAGLSPKATAAAAALTKPTGNQTNDLARAAIAAVPKLAAAAGHPIKSIRILAPVGGNDGPSTIVLLALALAAFAAAGTIITLRNR